jgi:hypothetical protein
MAIDLNQLMALLATRMQQLGATPDDPRLAPLIAQAQASMQQGFARMVWNSSIGELATGAGDPGRTAEQAHVAAPVDDDLPTALSSLLQDYCRFAHEEAARPRTPLSMAAALAWYVNAPALSDSEAGRRLLALGPADKARVATCAYVAWVDQSRAHNGAALRRVVSDLLRAKLAFDDEQAVTLVKAATREGFGYASYSPNQAVATTLKRHVEAHGLSPALRAALSGLRGRMTLSSADSSAQGRKLLSIVDAMLADQGAAAGSEPRFKPKPDAWGKAVEAKLTTLPFELRAHLGSLLTLASKGGENAKPGKGWLKTADNELDRVGRDRVGPALLELVECHEPGANIAIENQNTLRALIWLAAMAAPAIAGRRLETYAQKCLTFSSAHFAYLSLILGNATVHAFSLMPGTTGVGSLSRLKRRLKRPGEIKTVDKAIAALAAARGMSSGELEEIGLPDYGFDACGTLAFPLGPTTAELEITEEGALETRWRGADGRALSGPPAAVKEGHGDALKAFKAQAKEIGETLKAQRLRLERLYLDGRVWPLEVWRARYLDEPLVSRFARRLIWSFDLGDRWVAGLPQADGIFNAAGTKLDLDATKARVKLWHPMQSVAAHVVAWRRRLASLGITQPFKQAHREIYILTDAERATRVYSNRFAAHIVNQHKFRALAQARGWKCPAFGGWDPGDGRPSKRLADRELQVEFWVDPVESSMDRESFQFQHLSTDQVRFVTIGGEPMPLDTVDPVLFSELMRDADLFVGVASVGNDPTWGDRGADHFGGYWGEAAFGALTETGRTRHAVLQDLIPGLSIAKCCRLEDRYLVVDGKIRTYRIHLGSGNIHMEPNNQYLCIVQDRQHKGGNVRLPFEGDATLSLIISKAFMLVDDDKIKDAGIRSQIGAGLPGGA